MKPTYLFTHRYWMILGCFLILIVFTGCNGGNEQRDRDPSVITVSRVSPRSISATAYGQNYWNWVSDWQDDVKGDRAQMAAIPNPKPINPNPWRIR